MLFNIIVTTPKGKEKNVAANLYYFLRSELGDEKASCKITSYQGVIIAYTSVNVKKALSKLKSKLFEDNWYLSNFNKIMPVDLTTETNIEKIKQAALKLSGKVKRGETFKIEVKNRGKKIDSAKLISELAEYFQNKVDLENPDKTVRVEVLEDTTGLTVLDKDSIITKKV